MPTPSSIANNYSIKLKKHSFYEYCVILRLLCRDLVVLFNLRHFFMGDIE